MLEGLVYQARVRHELREPVAAPADEEAQRAAKRLAPTRKDEHRLGSGH